MRIAMILGQFPILSENIIYNQITGLISKGHQVDIYTLDRVNKEIFRMIVDIEHIKLNVQTCHLGYIHEVTFLNALKILFLLSVNFCRNPIKTVYYLYNFKIEKNRNIFQKSYILNQLINKKPYSIVHFQFGSLAQRFDEFIKLPVFSGAKTIISFRGYDISRYLYENGKDAYIDIINKPSLVLPVCEYFKNKLITLGFQQDNIVVLHSGICCDKFKYSERKFKKNTTLQLISVGRIIEKKGFDVAIRAVAELVKINYKVHYKIIGDGELKADLIDLTKRLNLTEHVEFLGCKIHKDCIPLLNQSHIFIAPSIKASDGNEEGIPNTLKEAMAIGLPVISTRHSGIPELIHEGKTGRLVEENDVQGIVNAVCELMNNPEKWSVMTKAARQEIENRFEMNKLNAKLIELYETVLA